MRRLIPTALAALLLLPAAPAAAQSLALRDDCVQDLPAAQCGILTVPLDHDDPAVGSERLTLTRVPATGPRRGVLVLLGGGPGEQMTGAEALLLPAFGRVRRDHDIVFLDQRGTGPEAPVDCDGIASARDVGPCAERLGPRREHYTTRETAFDIDDLRAALGVERLTLWGGSYGTKVAAEYARRFPARTAAVVLDSPAPVDGLDALPQLPQLARARVLREICAPGLCSAALADPERALATVVRRLQRAPLRGRVVLPSGRKRAFNLTELGLYVLVAFSDLDPFLRAELPAALASAVRGDAAPLLRLAAAVAEFALPPGRAFNEARLLATACVESRLPWDPASPLAGRVEALQRYARELGPDAFAPFRPGTVVPNSLAAACAVWPATPPPQAVPTAGPDVPVLVLVGREDLRTPLEDARRSAAQYPRATLLAVPDVGHSVLLADFSGCARRAVETFLAGGEVARCERGPRRPLPAAAVLPATLEEAGPATAVAVTLYALGRQLVPFGLGGDGNGRVAGLRGGVAVISRGAVRLDDLEWVRGVRISGTIRRRATRLTVAGAARGSVAGRTGRPLRGVLDGRRVTVTPLVDRVAARQSSVLRPGRSAWPPRTIVRPF